MALDKASFLERSKPAVVEVAIPELGETAYVRVMTGTQRDTFERMVRDQSKGSADNLRGTIAAWVLCDADGNRLFEDRDARELGMRDGRILQRVFDAAVRESALSAEEVEAVEGN